MTDELEVEVIKEDNDSSPLDKLTPKQYVKYCIFEEYIRSEFRGEVSVRMMDTIYLWIMDDKVPREPKDKSHLKEVT